MRIVSGIQPSSDTLHLGNYFGAIAQWVELQKTNECFWFIADLHALTDNPSPEALRRRIISVAQDYIALGIDPTRSTIFLQSAVSEHTQLMWLLSTVAAVGDLERMTQYKDKSSRASKKEGVNAGLLLYPVLMAADILLYKPEAIPVGEDQLQHLELTREIARRFNHRFGMLFKEPKPLLSKSGARIMSLTDPAKKMSKSLGPESYVGIFDDPDIIRKKFKKAVTDSGNEIKYDLKTKPALANLLNIFHLVSGQSIKEIETTYASKGYAQFKKDLAETVIAYFTKNREKRNELEKNPSYTEKILAQGAETARALAATTLQETYQAMGLR